MSVMRAVVLQEGRVGLDELPAPTPGAHEVVIAVAVAGVCRTDLAVADGTIATARPRLVLGHELAGFVHAVGAAVTGLAIGAPVTAIPFTPCGRCACGDGGRCGSPRWLGVDLDGAFADLVCVSARAVVVLPVELPLVRGAYVEPVAAALGVLASIAPTDRVLVSGAGRIAELTARVVAAHGATVVRHDSRWGDSPDAVEPACVDVAIEHGGDPGALLAALRIGGTLLLRSRAARTIALPAGTVVARELRLRGVSHGSFRAAVDWLHTGRVVVDDLIAVPRPLEQFAAVMDAARASEQLKQMFEIGPR